MAEKSSPTGRAIVTLSRGWQTLVAARSLGILKGDAPSDQENLRSVP
jgi:hypothetical protein